jgi:hypothetical protein
MPRTHIVLYRQLLQTLRRMDRAGLPCTGFVGMPQASQVLCSASYLRQAFRTESSSDINSRLTGRLGNLQAELQAAAAVIVSTHSPCNRLLIKRRLVSCLVRVADAFYALRMLPKQLAVLQASEEDTRQVCTVRSSAQTPIRSVA